MTRSSLLLGLAALVLMASAPLFAPWTRVILTFAAAKGFAVLGVVVLLRAGQVSFGHAMFFATGAYAAAYLGGWFAGADLLLTVLAGAGAAAILGAVVGLLVVRYRYIFFSMLNLALSMVLYSVLEKFYQITGGSDGLRVLRPTIFGQELDRFTFETVLFYGTLVLLALTAWLTSRYLASPLGQALQAIKTNETRLEYIGVSPRAVLLTGYIVSAALAGMGGTLLGVAQGLVTPVLSYWVTSGEFVFIAILGGVANVGGAFVGAVVYELVRTYAAAYLVDAWQMVLGFVLLAIILFAPGGIASMFARLTERRRGAERAHAIEEPAE